MTAELLTQYGPIARLWWDDYGLTRRRRLTSTYPSTGRNPGGFPAAFSNFTEHVRSLQNKTVILPGPDGCLVGASNTSL
jgi:hypothetical protein